MRASLSHKFVIGSAGVAALCVIAPAVLGIVWGSAPPWLTLSLTLLFGGGAGWTGSRRLVRDHALLKTAAETLTARAIRLHELSHRGDESLRLDISVDHVRGLVDGARAIARDGNPVAERRPLEGRVAHILDTQQLLEEAEEIVRRSVIGEQTSEGEKLEKNSRR